MLTTNPLSEGERKLRLIEIELEIRRRRKLKTFPQYLEEVSPTWTWDAPHLRYMQAQLQDITDGTLRYLEMTCPPRHGKTEQNTVRYAAYRLERDPTTRIILVAYNLKLAKKFSRKIYNLIKSRVEMDPSQRALDDWATAAGGGVRAAGIRSGVTGTGADLILLDDTVKSRVEANSQAYRDQLWDTFTDDIYTRQEPGCAIVNTLTRWHEADISGQIKASDIASDWRFINLPAIAEEGDLLGRAVGEALWPARYPIAELEKRKRLMKLNFYALFQGQPQPAEGNEFKSTWFRYWTSDPKTPELLRLGRDDGRSKLINLKDCRVFATGDIATSEDARNDFTVFALWAVTPDSDLILLDLWRDQLTQPDILKLAFDIQLTRKPSHFTIGTQGIGLPLVQNMRRGRTDDDGKRWPGIAVRGVTESTSKTTKATTAIIRTEAGQVYFPAEASWLTEFTRELTSFPGAHDDQVDAFAFAAEEVFWNGGAPEPEEITQAREDEAKAAAKLVADSVRSDPDHPHWWPDDDE